MMIRGGLAVVLVAALGCRGAESQQLDCRVAASTSIALTEVSPVGFALSEVLPFAVGPHLLPYEWQRPERFTRWADLGSRPLNTQLNLQIQAAQSARFVDMESPDGECADRLEVDATVALSTADGLVAHSFGAVLTAKTAHEIGFVAAVDRRAFGQIVIQTNTSEIELPEQLLVMTEFSRLGVLGMITFPPKPPSSEVVLAQWPYASACEYGGLPLRAEAPAPGPANVMALFTEANPMAFSRAPGLAETITIVPRAIERAACHRPPHLEVGVDLPIDAPDANVHATLPLRVDAEILPGGDLGFPEVQVKPPCSLGMADAQEFTALCGDWGADLSGFDRVYLETRHASFSPSYQSLEIVVVGVRVGVESVDIARFHLGGGHR